MSSYRRKEPLLIRVLKILLWAIILPIAAIAAYKQELAFLSTILSVLTLLIGWWDVVESDR